MNIAISKKTTAGAAQYLKSTKIKKGQNDIGKFTTITCRCLVRPTQKIFGQSARGRQSCFVAAVVAVVVVGQRMQCSRVGSGKRMYRTAMWPIQATCLSWRKCAVGL